MKKEVFLAISIGFILGLVITFGVWTANKSLKSLPQSTPTPAIVSNSTSPSPGPSVSPAASLTITSPDPDSLVDKTPLTVKGTTTPNTAIAITANTGEQIVTADASGNFSVDVDLEGGYNIISVTAFDSTGASVNKKIIVTYTTSKI